ncbi:MAG: hypothetical protein ABIQ74_11745 [Chitinophagales bacterium]
MTFEFRAHHPSAYSRFVIFLLLLVTVNIVLISIFYPYLKSINDAAAKCIILIIPWLALLLLPSGISGILIYRSFVKTYRFTLHPATKQETNRNSDFIIELLRKKKSGLPFLHSLKIKKSSAVHHPLIKAENNEFVWKKEFKWSDIMALRVIDFEDNHYCNLEFSDKRNNLVIHRESGEFDKFYEMIEIPNRKDSRTE